MISTIRKYLGIAVVALTASLTASASLTEPTTSALSAGKWVKIRVEADGMYQFTDAELRALGFSSPEKVCVYGYPPTMLLTHDFNLMPVDVSQIASLHDGGKLVFYAKSNVDLEPEIWRYEKYKASASQTAEEYPKPSQFEHIRHVFSQGATYFLSDADAERVVPAAISAPTDAPDAPVATSHVSIQHNEQDINQYGVGGTLYVGDVINTPSGSVTYPFSVAKVANDGAARIIFQGMDNMGGKYAPLLTTFSGEIKARTSEGAQMAEVITSTTHQLYAFYRRYQNIELPVVDSRRDYTLTFSVNPAFSKFSLSAIDYWTLLYSRKNDLSGETQRLMCFDTKHATGDKRFSVNNLSDGSDWRFWDVTDPLNIGECEMSDLHNGSFVGQFSRKPEEFAASYVAAFDLSGTLPSPEVVGEVANQNLHGMSTPDAVVLTSAMFADVSEELADFHREMQGLDVRVVDQQLIFNEFGSGNISPESVRRFLAHLDRQDPGKLKALIIVGPAVVDNAKNISPDTPFVVTAQNESDEDSGYQVRSFYSDSFYGRFSAPLQTGNWSVRHRFYQVLGNEQNIGVGRLPFSRADDVRAYIKKMEEYMTLPRSVPSMGTVIGMSDYEGSSTSAMHYADCEVALKPLAERLGKELTIVRPAANFYNSKDTKMIRRLFLNTVRQGSDLMLYFGHGRPDALGSFDANLILTISEAGSYSSPGHYPFAFVGSCNTARCDVNPNNIITSLVGNPHGGMIGVIASTREVYQQENAVLGIQVVREYDNAKDGDYWGDVYRRAESKAISAGATNRRTVLNHLCYTLLGDPLIPVYKASGTIDINAVNSGNATLYAGASNTISGSVKNAEGEVDTMFDGTVILTVYDAPTTRKNLVAKGSTSDAEYMASITEDFSVLEQIAAPVRNGLFSVDFSAPKPLFSGSQRIQAYAFSKDDSSSALGYIDGLTTVTDPDREPLASKGDIKVNSLEADNADFETSGNGSTVIKAEIYAPNGFKRVGGLGGPVRLSVDGVSHPEVALQLTYKDNATYTLVYETSGLAAGRHIIDLYVADDCGGEDSRSLEFAVNDAPEVELDAEYIGNGKVTVNCLGAENSQVRVIVENLHGDLIKSVNTDTLPVTIDGLPAGVYRVYTQHRGDRYYASSPKSVVIVD